MRIKTPKPDKENIRHKKAREGKEPEKVLNWDKGTGFDEPLPMREPEVTKYSMRNRDKKIAQGIHPGKGGMILTDDGKRRKHSAKHASMYEAAPHTVWVRKDIWAAIGIYTSQEKRSIRSVVEEALYYFLIKEGRVKDAEDLGEGKDNASWTHSQ